MAPQPTRSAHGHRMHHLFCMARPTTGSGSLPFCPTHPLPRSLLGTHSDPSVPAPGLLAPCCPHAQTAPRGALHPPWRHHGSWRRTFTDDATGPGRFEVDAGRLEWTNTHGMLTHYRDRGGQGGRVGVTQFMAAAACDGALGSFLPARTFGFGCSFHQALSHKHTGSISTVEVGWFLHRSQPP